jgi:hypothetical protein
MELPRRVHRGSEAEYLRRARRDGGEWLLDATSPNSVNHQLPLNGICVTGVPPINLLRWQRTVLQCNSNISVNPTNRDRRFIVSISQLSSTWFESDVTSEDVLSSLCLC